MDDAELEAQAQAMAEKALAALPEGVRAVKMQKVKEGILKRLKDQAAAGGGPPPPAGSPPPAGDGSPMAAGPAMLGGMPPPPPPSGPPPAESSLLASLSRLPGVEACGDEAWFTDNVYRRKLRDAVRAGHAEQKILVGAPADEIRRICPGPGRVLGAGAVLRLGGALLGGYGESDIAYAYRQLSRALHPDKNPDVPEAQDAFKRLSEAAEELRQGLTEQRQLLASISGMLNTNVVEEQKERPQEALFAEATRMLHAVLALSGEGTVPPIAVTRAVAYFTASSAYGSCQAQMLLSEWYDQPRLLELFAGPQIRTAYDCSKKKLRAQFLCALNRATMAEAKRHNDCVRGNWHAVMAQFPEIGLWREFHEKLKVRVWSRTKEEKEQDKKEKGSLFDQQGPLASSWAKRWRGRICAILTRGLDGAVPWVDPDVRQLCVALWEDVVAWARTPEVGCERHLQFFTAEPPPPGSDEPPATWAYVPAADLLLVVGEHLVGITAEGLFAENREGHERMSLADAMADKWEELEKKRREEERKKREEEENESKGKDKDEKKNDFDWEQVWRTRMAASKGRRGARGSSPAPRDRRRSRSRDRKRSRSRRRKESRSRDRSRGRSKRRKEKAASISS